MRLPRSTTVLIIALVLLAGLQTVVDQFRPISDSDFFWHLKTGEWIWQHKALPSQDPFAYTTPPNLNFMQRFTLTSYWLSQTAFYLLFLAGGFQVVVLFKFVLMGLLVLTLIPRRRGDAVIFAGVLVLGVVALGIFPLERPQAFSFILYGALLGLLASVRDMAPESRGRLVTVAATPALMLVWANMHGGYLLGQATILLFLALEGVKFLRRDLRPMPAANYRILLIAGLLGLAFSLVNPNTYHAVEYLKGPVLNSEFLNLEYQSTLFILTRLNLYRIAIYWLLLMLTLFGLAARWRKPDITTIALLVGLGGVSFFRSRYVPFFIVAAVPVAAYCLSGDRARKWSRPAVVILALLSVCYFSWTDRSAMIAPGSGMWTSRDFPEQEADFIIRQDLKGNMYNTPDWGGYLMWRLAPARKVFIDGRGLDVPSYLSARTIESGPSQADSGVPGWKSFLDANNIQYLVLPLFTHGVIQPLVNTLMNAREWNLVFAGYNSLIFVRPSPENSRVIATRSQSKDRFLDDMIAWYTEEAARKPGSRFVHLARGELLLSRQRFAEARAAYTRVLELAPFNLVARSRLRTIP